MSKATELYVRTEEGRFITVFLGKRAAEDLFAFLHPQLLEMDSEIGNRFYGMYLAEVMEIDELPARYFPAVYALIMQACNEVASLAPFKDELKAVLESDPRFQDEAAA